ncbi:MAG TPA: hypothetical protein PLV59_01960 [Candidatus Dojkabacteria bacterium]|nr:hypothetical protein [Candidatus Dojkabacteria bacterium]
MKKLKKLKVKLKSLNLKNSWVVAIVTVIIMVFVTDTQAQFAARRVVGGNTVRAASLDFLPQVIEVSNLRSSLNTGSHESFKLDIHNTKQLPIKAFVTANSLPASCRLLKVRVMDYRGGVLYEGNLEDLVINTGVIKFGGRVEYSFDISSDSHDSVTCRIPLSITAWQSIFTTPRFGYVVVRRVYRNVTFINIPEEVPEEVTEGGISVSDRVGVEREVSIETVETINADSN